MGGKEIALINLANYLASHGFNVRIHTCDNSVTPLIDLDKSIKVIPHSIFPTTEDSTILEKIWARICDFIKIKNILSRYSADYIVSTDTLITITLFFASFLSSRRNYKIIAWEHLSYINIKSKYWVLLRRLAYKRIFAIVALNPEEKSFYKSLNPRSVYIPNPVRTLKLSPKYDNSNKSKIILSVGRFSSEKGFDLIIPIASKFLKNKENWKFRLIGDGPLREDLIIKIKNNNLENKVEIEGFKRSIEEDYANAAILLMTSFQECFPLVLLEAMSMGVPCVSFNCPTGPKFIIEDGLDGFLVEPLDIDSVVERLELLAENEELRCKMGNIAAANIKKKFNPEKIYPLWLDLFKWGL